MSTRLLASIGVVLCMVVTTFSIYLGTVENVFGPTHYSKHQFAYPEPSGQVMQLCVGWPKLHPNTTTSDAPSSSSTLTISAGNNHCTSS